MMASHKRINASRPLSLKWRILCAIGVLCLFGGVLPLFLTHGEKLGARVIAELDSSGGRGSSNSSAVHTQSTFSGTDAIIKGRGNSSSKISLTSISSSSSSRQSKSIRNSSIGTVEDLKPQVTSKEVMATNTENGQNTSLPTNSISKDVGERKTQQNTAADSRGEDSSISSQDKSTHSSSNSSISGSSSGSSVSVVGSRSAGQTRVGGNSIRSQTAQPVVVLVKPVQISHAMETARAALVAYTGTGITPIIHQVHGLYHDGPPKSLQGINSFIKMNPEFTHILWGEADVDIFVDYYFPALAATFRQLLLPVLKADFVRYLLVFTFGGVYSDTDTVCLKPIREWGDRKQDISLIVGVEADAKNIPDWEKSYGRQLQIVQWTFAAAPGHPVLANTFFRISKTLSHMVPSNITVKEVTTITGPSVWTDAIYDHIAAQGKHWTSLLGMTTAQMLGDMYLLTITGFSPGVGHMGAGPVTHADACVRHNFDGSWTKQEQAAALEIKAPLS